MTKRTDYEAILDEIAELVAPNDGPGWCDADGLLESIGNIIESTGRTINWDGEDYDVDEDEEDDGPIVIEPVEDKPKLSDCFSLFGRERDEFLRRYHAG